MYVCVHVKDDVNTVMNAFCICAFDYVAGCNTVLCIYTHALCYIVMSARILVLSKQFIYDVYIGYLRVIIPVHT